jgi:DNA-binding CsgD family transcriptional regulator
MQAYLERWRHKAKSADAMLVGLIAFQFLCILVFGYDIVHEFPRDDISNMSTAAVLPELLATLGLALGIVVEWRLLRSMQRRQTEMARGLSVAAGAINELMRRYFAEWDLTPAECDVAAFMIKGYSITEVAGLRGSAEGTVKAQLNAIYRKAGVSGRAQLVSLLVEDLFSAPLLDQTPSDAQANTRARAGSADAA